MKVSLFTGGKDPHYALGLLSGLPSRDMTIDFIGNDEMKASNIVKQENIHYYNLRGDQNPSASLKSKVLRVLKYYFAVINYAAKTDSKLFHILWLNKFMYFDCTLLNIFYKLLGKKLVFTAHNVNIRERDGSNTLLNRASLNFMYKLVDHIFVHSEKARRQLCKDFKVDENKVTVIPFGINNIIPRSELTRSQAKKKLGLEKDSKVMLFFGNIAPYKGLENLIMALVRLKDKMSDFQLVIAGRIKDRKDYWGEIERTIEKRDLKGHILCRTEYIPDEDVAAYYKAADVVILPYNYIYQSGVLFLAYSFGLPVIATDVGSLREEIIEGATGFVCRPGDPLDLAGKIDMYFQSDLFKNLEENRCKIIAYANEKYSWNKIGERTYQVYQNMLSS